MHHCYSLCDVVIIVYIHFFDCFCSLKGSRRRDDSSVNDMSCDYPGGCRGNIPSVSASKGCQVIFYECLWSGATQITEDARPKIVDPPLTLIFKMGLGGYCNLFCQYRQQILCFWLSATYCLSDYPGCNTKICWHSVDAHIQDGVGSVLL